MTEKRDKNEVDDELDKKQFVKLMTVTLYDIQELRKAAGNRVDDFGRKKGTAHKEIAEELRVLIGNTLNRLETEMENRVSEAVKDMPIMIWLRKIHGIGPRYSGSLAAIVIEIERFRTISALWAYCGMHVIPVCMECKKIAYFGSERIRFCMRQAERRWRIYTTSREYEGKKQQRLLFSVEVDAQIGLNSGTISEDLLRKFEGNRISLSDDVAVSAGETDSRWLITDADETYIVEKQADKLNVYQKGIVEDEEVFKSEWFEKTDSYLCQHEQGTTEVLNVAPQRKYFKNLLLDHNPFAKSTAWKIAGQFVRQGKFYRIQYEMQKARYEERDKGKISDGQLDLRARRAMVKLFLSHLWEMWRKSEGLPAGEPWLMAQRGMDFRTHKYIPPPYTDTFKDVKAVEEAAD